MYQMKRGLQSATLISEEEGKLQLNNKSVLKEVNPMLRHGKAQSTAEYVIVLGLIVAAVIAMQTYVKRGFQGRIKDAVDYVDQNEQNEGVVNFTTKQYEPYYLESSFSTERGSTETESLAEGGAVSRESEDSSSRSGTQTLQGPKQDD